MNIFLKWLVTFYILSILAWSGLARAEDLIIDQVTYDSNHFKLALSGRGNNACGVSLKTKIIENQFTEESPIALVEVINNKKIDVCPFEQANEYFDMELDIRSLGLKEGQHYNLTFANSFGAAVNPIFSVEIPKNSIYPNYNPYISRGILGKQSATGRWYLLIESGSMVELMTDLDLTRYLGQKVIIEGTEFLHRTGPVFEVDESIPLRTYSLQKTGPSVFLFSIGTATY